MKHMPLQRHIKSNGDSKQEDGTKTKRARPALFQDLGYRWIQGSQFPKLVGSNRSHSRGDLLLHCRWFHQVSAKKKKEQHPDFQWNDTILYARDKAFLPLVKKALEKTIKDINDFDIVQFKEQAAQKLHAQQGIQGDKQMVFLQYLEACKHRLLKNPRPQDVALKREFKVRVSRHCDVFDLIDWIMLTPLDTTLPFCRA